MLRTCHCLIAVLLTMLSVPRVKAQDGDASPLGQANESSLFNNDILYVMSLLRKPVVQSDVNLAPEQQVALNRLAVAHTDELKELLIAMQGTTGNERATKQRQLREVNRKHAIAARALIKGLLSQPQFERMKQIYWQQIGPAALGDHEIARRLALTREQIALIGDLRVRINNERKQELNRQRSGLRTGISTSGSGVVLRHPGTALNQEAVERLTTLLTASQREEFARLLGKPFVIDKQISPREDANVSERAVGGDACKTSQP